MLGGDSNKILYNEEKGGGVLHDQGVIHNFLNALDDCSLRDMGCKGACFTWERGRTPDSLIQERLDRFITCSSWCSSFLYLQVQYLTKYQYDHAAIFLRTDPA